MHFGRASRFVVSPTLKSSSVFFSRAEHKAVIFFAMHPAHENVNTYKERVHLVLIIEKEVEVEDEGEE